MRDAPGAIQDSACSVAKRAAWSWLPKSGTKRNTRSSVMLPRPLRIDTDAAKRSLSRRRMMGEIRYFPTWREV